MEGVDGEDGYETADNRDLERGVDRFVEHGCSNRRMRRAVGLSRGVHFMVQP